MEAGTGDGAEAHGAEQKSGGKGEGGKEEEAQATSQTMPSKKEHEHTMR